MSEPIPFPNVRKVRDEACTWIARLDRGLTAKERDELRVWLDGDARSRDMLLEMAQFWDQLDVLSELSELFPLRKSEPAYRGHRRLVVAVGSVAVLLVCLSTVLVLQKDTADSVTDPALSMRASYETAPGDYSSVQLSDGSVVTLNTNTSINVAFTEQSRSIALERGEAFFVVERDPARPFNVVVGSRLIQAVGTAFNVEIDRNDIVDVMVSEGTVRVALRTGSAREQARRGGSGPPDFRSESDILLSAGRGMRIGSELGSVYELQRAEIDTRLAWQRGMLIFRGETLEAVLEEVSRYTTTRFVVEEDALNSVRVGGYFRAGDVDGLLVALRENFDIDARRVGDDRIVLSAR